MICKKCKYSNKFNETKKCEYCGEVLKREPTNKTYLKKTFGLDRVVVELDENDEESYYYGNSLNREISADYGKFAKAYHDRGLIVLWVNGNQIGFCHKSMVKGFVDDM